MTLKKFYYFFLHRFFMQVLVALVVTLALYFLGWLPR